MLPVLFLISLTVCGIKFVAKTGAVTRRTKACHGAERPTLVLSYDVDTTKVTPVWHMQEVTGSGVVRELVWNEKAQDA
jgi:hypothetical protein